MRQNDEMKGLNPLHCGAVVALKRRTARAPRSGRRFQSPSLRGSGRFAVRAAAGARDGAAFQSPSLRGSGRFVEAEERAKRAQARFNPLHCGAVVALTSPSALTSARSLVSIPFIAGQWSLYARHGEEPRPDAVFQSPSLRGSGRFLKPKSAPARKPKPVSIPFIAGQWSLLWLIYLLRHVLENVSIPFIAGQWSL